MIARFFHAWEHRLASVAKDRVVRPFDWGADWLTNGHAGSGATSQAADAQVALWVDEIMRDTHAFFETPPSRDFTFETAEPAVRRTGEAGTLTFPSALVTPHAENN